MEQEEKRVVRPGELYRHFTGKLCQIVTVAIHWETEEAMVVYQQLYDNFRVYVMPYGRFVSPVDQERYPKAGQVYEFERVCPGQETMPEEKITDKGEEKQPSTEAKEPEPNPALLRFLAADTVTERMACLKDLASTASQRELDSVYLVLDMKQETGTIEEQVDAISRNLALQQRYDGTRLR